MTASTTPSGRLTARGSYLDRLLAELEPDTEPDTDESANDPDPQWQSWWDASWPVVDTSVPDPTSLAAEAAPQPRAPRRLSLRRVRLSNLLRAVHRCRLPGRGEHVARCGPLWSTRPHF